MTAGREAARPSKTGHAGIDAPSYRIVANALAGGVVDRRALEAALGAFAEDPDGAIRFEAMTLRAWQSQLGGTTGTATETVDVHRATAMLRTGAAFVRILGAQRARTERSYEQFATAVADITDAEDYQDVCQRAADAIGDLSGLEAAAVYVPGPEQARFVRAATQSGLYELTRDGIAPAPGDPLATPRGLEPPAHIRIDRGLFADVIAGDKPLFVSRAEPLEDLTPTGDGLVRTLIAVPMRDGIGRPMGLLLALGARRSEMRVGMMDGLRRLGNTVSGALASTTMHRRSQAALSTLPHLADVAHAEGLDITTQLEDLAAIVARATESDSAVIRVRDSAGTFLETKAVHSRLDDSVSDLIGGRTILDGLPSPSEIGEVEHELIELESGPDGWSVAGQRIAQVLGARSIASYPIGSGFHRDAVLYVIRKTSRSFDETDRACIRIVTGHAKHIIDRHVAELQTQRAISAAQNAIRMLGEALVAGIRVDRTLRFVPRLFHEMFDSPACRVWRRESSGDLSLISGVGVMGHETPSVAATQALELPLELQLSTEKRPHVAAVALDEYHGTRIVIEFELAGERSLGQEEQAIAADVAQRIAEALWSAGQSAAHERQLDRVRALQEVVSNAHEQLSEAHVVSTVLEGVPRLLRSAACGVFLFGESGALEARGSVDMPHILQRALERRGTGFDSSIPDDGNSVLATEHLGEDDRFAAVHEELQSCNMLDWGALLIPLTGHEQTLGILVLLFDGALPDGIGRRNAESANVLPAFGGHLGNALLNAREFERERNTRARVERMLDVERENSRQVRALHEVSRTFATSLSLDETMRAVVEAMAHRLDVDAVWIRTPGGRGDMMQLRAFYASHPELSGALERMVSGDESRDDPITSQVMQSRQPMLISAEDVLSGKHAGADVIERLSPFLQRGSTIAVLPVAIPNEVLGTLTMLSIDPEHEMTYDQVDIAAGVTSQAALALDNARLYQQQKNFAEIIQESLLPGRLPDVPGIELGVLYRSATAGGAEAPLIGGDFYDFLELEDGRLALAVGDVTGKGVEAAADTAMTKYIFRSLAREHPSPSSFLRFANNVVCEEITPGKFVTLFYAIIDQKRGIITCGSAGHPEPKIIRIDDDGEQSIESLQLEGLALGIMDDQDYEQRDYPFEEGSTIVVYTDGVVEARREGRLYGQFRLERRLADESGASAPQIAFAVYQDCAAYADDGLGDDVAIVVAQRVPLEER